MWACCGVEREVRPFRAERSRGLPTSNKQDKSFDLDYFNARNIGLGLMEQRRRSDQPSSFAENTSVDVPHLYGPIQEHSQANDDHEQTTSTGGADEGPGSNLQPLARIQKGKSFGGMGQVRKSRSSRLLIEGEEEEDGEEDKPEEIRAPLQRRPTVNSIMTHNSANNKGLEGSEDQQGGIGGAKLDDAQTSPRSMMQAVRAKLPKAFGGGSKGSSSPPEAPKVSPESEHGLYRRDSQANFGHSSQTAIILDWDDTLFPTSYLIDDLRLNHRKLMKDQRVSRRLLDEVSSGLKELESWAMQLVNCANGCGRVILVTLARPPWVEQSCRCFYPAIGELIRQLRIKVVYAQEGVAVDYNRRKMMSDGEIERVYSDMKGKAISREVKAFYSQYEGQSWKNIISIGDSNFERIGTMRMSNQYLKDQGVLQGNDLNHMLMQRVATGDAIGRNQAAVEVNGHVYKVRTKTFKMLEYPTIGELSEELTLLQAWLPKMVALDDGFDADLNNLDDPHLIDTIEEVLSGLHNKQNNHVKTNSAPAKFGNH